MNERLFSLLGLAAMIGWLGLGLAACLRAGPWRQRLLFAGGRIVPVGLCAAYAVLLAAHWGSTPGGGFGSLAAVQALFAAPGKMLGAWTHFLAFDLLVGRWLVDDVLARGRARWPLAFTLPATFLFGPLGVLLHVATGARPRAAV